MRMDWEEPVTNLAHAVRPLSRRKPPSIFLARSHLDPGKAMHIAKVGVVGAGAMGTGMPAYAASAGLPVVLLDVPADPDRNARARGAVQNALKAKMAPFMDPERASRIVTGNTEDHFDRLGDCDWIVEAIIEQIEPKQRLFERIETV